MGNANTYSSNGVFYIDVTDDRVLHLLQLIDMWHTYANAHLTQEKKASISYKNLEALTHSLLEESQERVIPVVFPKEWLT
jgi:hypothetical protein